MAKWNINITDQHTVKWFILQQLSEFEVDELAVAVDYLITLRELSGDGPSGSDGCEQ